MGFWVVAFLVIFIFVWACFLFSYCFLVSSHAFFSLVISSRWQFVGGVSFQLGAAMMQSFGLKFLYPFHGSFFGLGPCRFPG